MTRQDLFERIPVPTQNEWVHTSTAITTKMKTLINRHFGLIPPFDDQVGDDSLQTNMEQLSRLLFLRVWCCSECNNSLHKIVCMQHECYMQQAVGTCMLWDDLHACYMHATCRWCWMHVRPTCIHACNKHVGYTHPTCILHAHYMHVAWQPIRKHAKYGIIITMAFVRLCCCSCCCLPRTSLLENWRPGTLCISVQPKNFSCLNPLQCMI